MGKPGAFLDIDRVTHELRPVEERSRDFDPLYVELDDDARRAQASRCMVSVNTRKGVVVNYAPCDVAI